MKKTGTPLNESFLKSRKWRGILRRAIAVLSAFVLLFTMNTLKRHADTLEHIPMCHLEEHVHSGDCYDSDGNLVCGMEEHVHTDACYQERPTHEDVPEEIEVDLDSVTEEEETEVGNQEAEEAAEQDLPQDALDDEPEFRLEAPVLLSEIISQLHMDVNLRKVLDVGAVEDDAAHAGLVLVERLDGDYRVSALRPFDETELALVLSDDILLIKLIYGAPDQAPAEAPSEASVEQTPDETENQTEVASDDTTVDTTVDETTDATADEAADVTEGEANGKAESEAEGQTEVASDDTAADTAVEETADEAADETADEAADATDGEADGKVESEAEDQTEVASNDTADDATVEETADESADETADEAADAATDAAVDENTDEAAGQTEVDSNDKAETVTEDEAQAESDKQTEVEVADEANDDAADDTADETADNATDAADDTHDEDAADAADDTNGTDADAADKSNDETADAADDTNGTDADAADKSNETADSADETTDDAGDEATDETGDGAEDAVVDETEEGDVEDATDETGDETDDETDETAEPTVEEQNYSASVTVDLSGVDMMDAATIEGTTVTLSVADLLEGKDDAVSVEGELDMDSADFIDNAEVTSSDVLVEDGMITLSADALDQGTVSLQLQTETTEGDVTTVTTQTVDIELNGYAGRTMDEIDSDPGVQVVPVDGNSLPADAYAAISDGEVPQDLLSEPTEGVVENAAAYDITVRIDNENKDELSNTGDVTVTVTPNNLNVLEDVPEGATIENITCKLYHVHDDGTRESVEDVAFDVAEDGTVNSFTFNTDGFSTYVIVYTVEFHNDDAKVVVEGGSQVLLSTLIDRLNLTRANGDTFTVDEVQSVSFATPDLFDVSEVFSGELTLNAGTPKEQLVEIITAHDFLITSLRPFDEDSMTLVLTDGETIVVQVTDHQYDPIVTSNEKYTVNLIFQDAQGGTVTSPSFPGSYSIYASTMLPQNGNGDLRTYYFSRAINGSTATVEIPYVFRDNVGDYRYYSFDEVIAANAALDIKLVKDLSIDPNNEERGRILSGAVLGEGDTVGTYVIRSIRTDEATHTTTITLKQGDPYHYTITGYGTDGATTEAITLPTEMSGNWYLVTKLVKNGGANYYHVQPVDFQNKSVVSGDIATFVYDNNGALDTSNVTVYGSNDIAETRLVRMSGSGNTDKAVVDVFKVGAGDNAKKANTDSRYFTGRDALYQYTVRTVDSSGYGRVDLTKAATPKVVVQFRTADGAATTDALLSSDYWLVARHSRQENSGYAYAYVAALPKQATSVVDGVATAEVEIPEFVNSESENIKKVYVAGEYAYELFVVKATSKPSISDALNGVNYNASAYTYHNGDVLESTQLGLVKTRGTASRTETTLTVTRIPALTVNAKVYNGTGANAALAADGALTNYYLLFAMSETVNNSTQTSYALQALDVKSKASETYSIGYLTDDSGNYHYYVEGKQLSAYLLAANQALTLNDAKNALAGNSNSVAVFANGSLTAQGYRVGLSQSGYTVDLALNKVTVGTPQAHTAKTYFYAADQTTVAKANPVPGTSTEDTGHTYYVVATLALDGMKQPVAYQVQAFDTAAAGSSGIVQTNFGTTYQMIDAKGKAVSGQTIGYDPAVFKLEARIYHKSVNLASANYNTLVSGSDLIPKYDFMSNEKVTVENTTITEIKLHSEYTKTYKVKLQFDPKSVAFSQASDKLYLYIQLNHRTTDPEYYLTELGDIPANQTEKVYDIPTTGWMMKDDGGNPVACSGVTVTGNETAIVRLLKPTGDTLSPVNAIRGQNCIVLEEGTALRGSTLSYATPQQVEEDIDNRTTAITDTVKLTRITATNDYSFAGILGTGIYYGISANEFIQQNHIQSNFAVNIYRGNDQPIEADLASAAGAFLAPNVMEKPIFIGTSHSGEVLVYVDENHTDGAIKFERDFVHVIGKPKAELEAQINAILAHGAAMSSALAAHAPTFTPMEIGKNYIEIDTLDFPEDATIYLDGDALRKYIGDTSGIKLTKHPNQTIVFNFSDPARVEIRKFNFRYSRDAAWEETDSPTGHDSEQNHKVDEIAKHIVWNIQNATDVGIDVATGIFLVPNPNALTTIEHTASGWIIAGGKVTNTDGEWHSVYGELPSVTTANLSAGKTVDGIIPTGNQVFDFEVRRYKPSTGEWVPVKVKDKSNPDAKVDVDTIHNTNGIMLLENICDMDVGFNIYRIRELTTYSENTARSGTYSTDRRVVYAVVQYVEKNNNGKKTLFAQTPVYYITDDNGSVTFNESAWNTQAVSLDAAFGSAAEGVKLSKVLGTPTFHNTTARDDLAVTKAVQGTGDATKVFNFTLTIWCEADSTHPGQTWMPWGGVNTAADPNAIPFTVKITGAGADEEAAATVILPSDMPNGVYSFSLKNGQTAHFNGLPEKHKYTVQEINGQLPGYTYDTTTREREIVSDGHNTETITNTYAATGSATLHATKVLQNVHDATETRELVAGQFGFRLYKDSVDEANLIETAYNEANGSVNFTPLEYTQDDMADATDNGDGTRTKVITYVVEEFLGDVGDNTGVTLVDPITVTVTLVDDGEGHINATADPDNFTVSFVNTYGHTKSIEVSKEWYLRPLGGGDPVLQDTGVAKTFQLYRTTSDIAEPASGSAYTPAEIAALVASGTAEIYGEPFTLGGDNPYTYSNDQLPKFDNQGNEYNYFVVETEADDTEYVHTQQTVGEGDEATTKDIWTVKNYEQETTNLKVVKVWKDVEDHIITDSKDGTITYKLWQTPTSTTVTQPAVETVSVQGSVKYGCVSWGQTQKNATFAGQLNGIKKGSTVRVDVRLVGNEAGNNGGFAGLTINGTQIGSPSNVVYDAAIGNYVLSQYTIENVQSDIVIAGSLENTSSNNTMTITVTVVSEPAGSTGSTTTTGDPETGDPVLVATVEMTKTSVTPAIAEAFANTVSIRRSGVWASTIDNLPATVVNGNTTTTYTYYVEEIVPEGADYQLVSISPATAIPDGSTITITNKETKEKGSVKVTKAFIGLNGTLPADFQITNDTTDDVFTVANKAGGSGTELDPYYWVIDNLDVGTVVTFEETGYDVSGYRVRITGSATVNAETGEVTATATVGTTPGVASFINTYIALTDFDFFKAWTNGVDVLNYIDWPENVEKISVRVTRRTKDTAATVDNDFYLDYDLYRVQGEDRGFIVLTGSKLPPVEVLPEATRIPTTNKSWLYRLTNLRKYNSAGVEWEYRVTETSSIPGFHVTYLGANNVNQGSLNDTGDYGVIRNDFNAARLPATGGAGTGIVYAAGIGLLLLAVVGWVLRARRRDHDA